MNTRVFPTLLLALAASLMLSGCLVKTAAGLAVTAVKVPVKAGAAVVGAAIPDGDDQKDKDDAAD